MQRVEFGNRFLMYWSAGVLECGSAGVRECWGAGVLGCWSAGVLGCWGAGVLGYFKSFTCLLYYVLINSS